ncbi:Hypothetical protein CINCED_3A013337 [Cinara cedri]|uniref:Uncharacterized protein n=1 Tax=Cinara cedri TaxID=506608 RepID=A0A5E4MTZ0_9HEMI|nr:Hypothetical protein CINCED_3A013337 [Cinara cedri]
MVENERSSTCNIRPHTDNEDEDIDDAKSSSVSPLQGEDSFVIKRFKKEKLSDILTKRAEERSKIIKLIEEQNQQVLNTEK